MEVAWGGTEVQNWVSNASLLEAGCKNLTGGPPNQAAYPPNTGSLWNGMILPIINMTIKGATWFQGEITSDVACGVWVFFDGCLCDCR